MARILIVDDDEIMAEAIIEVLGLHDHMTSAVHDGSEAIEAVIAGAPDLVILDYVLPTRSGLDILRAIRAMPGMVHIPVMMLTGKNGKLMVARAEHDGADDYMTKPFDPMALLQRAEALLKGATIARQAGIGAGGTGLAHP